MKARTGVEISLQDGMESGVGETLPAVKPIAGFEPRRIHLPQDR